MESLEEAKKSFTHILSGFKDELLAIRTNRPTTKLIEDIRVSYMGQELPIKQVGSLGIEPPRDLVVNVWDADAVNNITGALEEANLGGTVSAQGKTIRIKLPELTGERKEELTKIIRSMAEDIRIKMRRVRDDRGKEIKEIKDEDERFRAKDDLQKLVDNFNKEIDTLVENKSKEILE